MGTNYYLHSNECPHCGRSDEPLHIGKSSAGWCFSLHVIPDEGINSLDDWVKRWQTGVIRNEYRETISADEMYERITKRGPGGNLAGFDFARNHAMTGPNGMLRHLLGPYCVGHGDGTWDLIPGEFS